VFINTYILKIGSSLSGLSQKTTNKDKYHAIISEFRNPNFLKKKRTRKQNIQHQVAKNMLERSFDLLSSDILL
jgi:hypothetical protein